MGYLLSATDDRDEFAGVGAVDFSSKFDTRATKAIAAASKARRLPYAIRRRVINALFGRMFSHGLEFARLPVGAREKICAAYKNCVPPTRPGSNFYMLWCVVEYGHLCASGHAASGTRPPRTMPC